MIYAILEVSQRFLGHFFSRFETVFLVYEANSPLPNQSTDKSILHICLKLNLVQKHCANHWDVYYWNQTIFMSSKIDTHTEKHTFDSLRLSTWFNNWLVTAAGVVAAAFFCSFKNIQILNRTQSTDPFLFTLTTNLLFNFSTIWHRFESYIVAPHHLIFKFPRQVVSLKLLQRPEKRAKSMKWQQSNE